MLMTCSERSIRYCCFFLKRRLTNVLFYQQRWSVPFASLYQWCIDGKPELALELDSASTSDSLRKMNTLHASISTWDHGQCVKKEPHKYSLVHTVFDKPRKLVMGINGRLASCSRYAVCQWWDTAGTGQVIPGPSWRRVTLIRTQL